jgi:hypothetical protein
MSLLLDYCLLPGGSFEGGDAGNLVLKLFDLLADVLWNFLVVGHID